LDRQIADNYNNNGISPTRSSQFQNNRKTGQPMTEEKNRMSIDTDEDGKVGVALNAYASKDVEIGMI